MTISTEKPAENRNSKVSKHTGILDRYSPLHVGKILRTSTKKKPDIIETFRPKSEDHLNYDISQTNVKWDYGPTKINVKSTRATYSPLSEELVLAKLSAIKKTTRLSHGGPPLTHYVEDLWLAKQAMLQEIYKEELKEFTIRRKKRDKLQGVKWHTIIQAMVGPEWYQELSPRQLHTADQLKYCILQDIRDQTIIHTQENIGSLGLVLRPNYHNIKKALKFCCKCPVEFLLILYQLINPNRSKYTLNDRLLLSAVVHLTMRETLREMHIRIPSPPPPEKEKVKPCKKAKPKKYKSPYLVPYTFKPVPRKYSGIYVNKHVQYPESPYFDYRELLYLDINTGDDIFEVDPEDLELDEAEILKELKEAQAAYARIHKDAKNKMKLLKPIKKPPSQYLSRLKEQKLKLVLPPLAALPPDSDDDEVCDCKQIMEDTEDTESICCDDHFFPPCEECEGECTCRQKIKIFNKCKKCLARQRKKNLKRIIGGVKITQSENVIPMIEGTLKAKEECDCLRKYKERLVAVAAGNVLRCQRTKYNIGGVVMTSMGPVYNISTAITERQITDNNLEAEDEVCCEPKKENDNGSKPCTCGMSKPVEDDSCCRTNKESDNTCEMCKKAKVDSCNKPCTCGMGDIKLTTSNEPGVPCCGRIPDECSPHQCTCERQQDQTKKSSNRKDDGSCEHELSEPCECEDVCDCKEQSKLYTSPKCPRCLAREKLKHVQRIIGGLKKSRKNKYIPIIEGTRHLEECTCLQNYKRKLIGVAARNKIKCNRAKFIVGGVVMTRKGPVYILSTAFINKPRRGIDTEEDICCKRKKKEDEPHDDECICEECKHEDDIEYEEIIKYSACRCREELDKFLAHKCTCEDCNRERRQLNATHIIAGAKYTQSGTVINILEGIQEQRCDCLTQYTEKLKKLEDYRKRSEARYELMSQDFKYSIGGVVWTAEGPVYAISGMRPPVECDCAKEKRRKEEEEAQMSRRARMPSTGRIKYQISGVAQTPEGNVYIVSQALPIGDCDCVRLYNTFKEAHGACLDSYEEYLTQVRDEIEVYEAEAAEAYQKYDEDVPNAIEESRADEGVYMNFNFDHLKEESNFVSEVQETVVDEQEKTKSYVPAVTCDCLKESASSTSSSTTSTDTSSGSSMKHTSACTCTTPPGSEEEDSEEDDEKVKQSVKKKPKKYRKGGKKIPKKVEEYHSKRFYISGKIPCNEKEQMEIVKKILGSMADDGFSLAKLPDSYKLPHFKLWMQLRCGKFWTQRDRFYYENFTKLASFHSDHCYNEPPSPKLGIAKHIANQMTWKDAAYVRKIVSEKIGMFYRLARQENVETAREYFPLTFSYEFPTKTFRNCFFAYKPSKEENVLVYRIIKPYDARVDLKKYPCYC